MTLPSPYPRGERGFSLIELLVVCGIIVVVGAVGLPQIGRYIRNYKLRSAQQQVADQLQTARAKAVMKNVQLGVIWVQTSTATAGAGSGWSIEDDMQPTVAPNWSTWGTENLGANLADRAQSPGGLAPLPQGIDFDDPSKCPGGGLAANAWAIRWDYLGGTCSVGTTNCPPPTGVPAGTVNKIAFCGVGQAGCIAGDASVCLWDRTNNLHRRVTVTLGGRVVVE